MSSLPLNTARIIGRRWILIIWCLCFGALVISADVGEAATTSSQPWWTQQKIRYFWGQWVYYQDMGVPTEQIMKNLSQVGATVFVKHSGGRGDVFDQKQARLAHKYGMRYFGVLYVNTLSYFAQDMESSIRLSVDRDGDAYTGGGINLPCPLYRPVYEEWFLKPILEAAQTGLVDGLHMDWEPYGGRGEAEVCYCDDCFENFVAAKGLDLDQPVPKDQRYAWLEDQGLTDEYEATFKQRRTEMFRQFAQRVRRVKPNFIFAAYHFLGRYPEIIAGLHAPQAPFFVIDHRHYWEDHTRPWWESQQTHHKKQGYVRIAGTWDNALFGGKPQCNISAPQWMYDAAINSDGYWLWFEEELSPDVWRSFWIANRRIEATEQKVGDFLLHGQVDTRFVTLVEWTGDPHLARKLVQRTYHLGDRHLVHLHNVHTDWPVRLRLRFPRLRAESQWVVTDPIADTTYVHDGDEVVWTGPQLRDGIGLCLEKRSELFVQLTPAPTALAGRATATVPSDETMPMSSHAQAAASAPPPRLLYMMRNSIYDQRLRQVVQSATKVMDLPKTGWMLKPDKGENGVHEKWYLPDASTSDWEPVEIEEVWDAGTGSGWYRREVDFPALPEGKDLYLCFGAVDEEMILWIDGEYVGDYNRGPEGWDKPFAINVTGKLGPGKHQLVLRVYNSALAGGIWKPVSLVASSVDVGRTSREEKPTAGHALGRLVCTITELLGYPGLQAWAMGNAIHAVDSDGRNGERLRQVKGYLWSPAWSPDGSHIAFVHYANGRGQIYAMNADGSRCTNLSSNSCCDQSPAWSPDGNKIAFVSDRDGDWEIFVMNADGSDQRQRTYSPGRDSQPVWSPDGRTIAFCRDVGGDIDIYVTNADGLGERAVVQRPGDQWDPAWSPDSTHLACGSVGEWAEELLVANADTGQIRKVMMMAHISCPQWSPDGARLAGVYRGPLGSDNAGVFVIDAAASMDQLPAGDDERKLGDVRSVRPYSSSSRTGRPTPSWYSKGGASPRWVVKTFASVRWSPDGSRLAFSSDMSEDGYFYIYIVPVADRNLYKVEATRSAWPQQLSWCPQQYSLQSD